MKRVGWTILLLVRSGLLMAQSPDSLLLRDYRPVPMYQIPISQVEKARFPVIDMHSHPYAASAKELEKWMSHMDQCGIEKTIILTYATGAEFDSLLTIYNAYGNRFDVWCGVDYTGYDQLGWSQKAIKELERCFRKGAKGVGELGDKGIGLSYSHPAHAPGMHLNDPRMQPLLDRCGELGMPVNIHVAEPIWMYGPMDHTNDGLMNGYKWRVDQSKDGILLHDELIGTLEKAVKVNPKTIFIACHFANCSHDLAVLGRLLDRYPNLYADISARYGETAPIPRYMQTFYEQYQDRLLYGTDMGMAKEMYAVTFRILETADEHFYQQDYFNYHWPLHGFNLPDHVLKKLYYENARKILNP